MVVYIYFMEDTMFESTWNLLYSPTLSSILYGACGILLLLSIAFFSILASQAEARMWRAVHRHGGRRALQHQITSGRSNLR
jgi:hypothetical protein